MIPSPPANLGAPSGEADGARARPVRRGGRAYAFSFAGRGVRALGKVIVFIAAARLLPIDDVGRFAYLVVLGTLAGLVFDLGLSELVVREVSAGRFAPAALVVAVARARLAGLLAAIAVGVLAAWVHDGTLALAAIGSIAYGASGVGFEFVAAVRRAHGRYDLDALESALGATIPLAAVLVVAAVRGDATGFADFQIALGGAALVLALVRLAPLARGARGGAPPIRVAEVVVAGRWLLVRVLLAFALFEATPLVLRLLADEREIAIFAAALRPAGLLSHPFAALGFVFMPALAADLAADRGKLDARTIELNRITLAFTPPCFAGCIVGGGLLLRGLGPGYVAAFPTLVALAAAYSIFMGTFSPLPLITLGRERAVVIGQAIALALMAIAMVILVPRHGALGAALATLVGLTTTKVLNIAMYRAAGLPGDLVRAGVAVLAIAGWATVALWLPTVAGLIVLGIGGALSGWIALGRVRALVLFDSPPTRP